MDHWVRRFGISAANACVGKLPVLDIEVRNEGSSSTPVDREVHIRTVLMPAQKFDTGKRAAEIGMTATIWYYAKWYPDISERNLSSKI